jgi:predicted nucleic acid-binding protein
MTSPPALFPNAVGPPDFVLDVSVALAWIVPRLATSYTDGVMGAMARSTAVVPESWLIELAEELLTEERRGQLGAARVAAKLAVLSGYSVIVDDETNARAWGELLPLARTGSTSVYHAAYLELALRLGLPLATTDATLTTAANVVGVPIYTP